jgi:hypothetical protein
MDVLQSTFRWLKLSARETCYCSAYISILAMHMLSQMLLQAVRNGNIQGVYVPLVDQQGLHSVYADDIVVVFCAEPEYILHIKKIMQTFGDATGLFVEWHKTKLAFISTSLLPAFLEELGWEWEMSTNASKLLGFPTAQSISKEQMRATILTKLETNLEKSRQNPALLIARVTIANHSTSQFITAAMWYMLALWVGDHNFLTELQRRVTQFVWAR